MARKPRIIEPINATLEELTKAMANPSFSPTPKSNNNSGIGANIAGLVPPPSQPDLFHVERQVECDGVEMGVLKNGIPYLSEGLQKHQRKRLNEVTFILWLARYIIPHNYKNLVYLKII